VCVTGIENQLGRIAQGISIVADGHRHGAQNETKDNVGEKTERLGERHRHVGEEFVNIRVSRPMTGTRVI